MEYKDIKPYPKNAKKHDDKQIKLLAENIKRFGFDQHIVVDKKTGYIVKGHGRWLASQLLGLEKIKETTIAPVGADFIPVEFKEYKSEKEANAARLADNQIHDLTGIDMQLVIDELRSLEDDALVALSGFSKADIERAEWQSHQKLTLTEDFIIPPFSYWDTRQQYWQDRKRAWNSFFGSSKEGRDDNLLGEGLKKLAQLTKEKYKSGVGLTGTSEFDPVVAEICYKWFNVKGGSILDPFAGGVVRGAVAGLLGYKYTGIDLSEKQIKANITTLREVVKIKIEKPEYILGNSLELDSILGDKEFDMIFSCPPYYDLENYSDDPNDLSNKVSYDDFILEYKEIIKKAVGKLKDNRFAVFIVGDIRDERGFYRNFTADTIDAFRRGGILQYNDIILVNSLGTAPVRSRRPFSQNRKVTKVHQNILVFYKGDTNFINNKYIALPKVDRVHKNILVFYKGDVEGIKENYQIVDTNSVYENAI